MSRTALRARYCPTVFRSRMTAGRSQRLFLSHFGDASLHQGGLHGEGQQEVRDSGGWGYGVFDYDAASNTFKPGTMAGTPPQGNDAKCGFACHTRAKARDYVFTEYGKR